MDAADPEGIILVGSGARSAMGANNDVGLLVVKEGVHRRESIATR